MDEDDLEEALRLSRWLNCHAKLFVKGNEDRTSSVGFMFKGPRPALT